MSSYTHTTGEFMEMAKRVVAVEVKVDHLAEKLEVTNTTIENHSARTDKNFEEIGKALNQQKDDIRRITLWMEAAPKIIRIGIGIILAATLLSSSGWRVVLDMISNSLK